MLEYRQEEDRSNHGISVEEREGEVVVTIFTGASFGVFDSMTQKGRTVGQ
jgi:hypothetical protein